MCEAPSEEGVHMEYFRLKYKDQLFGPKFWCQIVVKRPVVEEAKKQEVFSVWGNLNDKKEQPSFSKTSVVQAMISQEAAAQNPQPQKHAEAARPAEDLSQS